MKGGRRQVRYRRTRGRPRNESWPEDASWGHTGRNHQVAEQISPLQSTGLKDRSIKHSPTRLSEKQCSMTIDMFTAPARGRGTGQWRRRW
jgi:hypothetical protein